MCYEKLPLEWAKILDNGVCECTDSGKCPHCQLKEAEENDKVS